MIAEELAGKRIAVTGATGFLGTALVERLLRAVPDCELVLLVRPGRRLSAPERTAREIIRNDCFDRLRNELGSAFADEIARRVTTIAGDVGSDGLGLDAQGRAILSTCDIVVHSAATVSFDAPLDGAVEVNLLGPSRVASTLIDVVAEMRPAGTPLPHLVAVSTAYVGSGHHGDAAEELVTESRYIALPEWRGEVAAARRARSDADAASRTPARLAELGKAARHELGAAGSALLAERTEKLRQEWVDDELVTLGRARAQALGWPDAYAYTKSLGEVALADSRGELPVSIVRPSIVESALAEPRPGWIRGFRMAEPVIISYARGLLKQFPGVPEGVIDVIPVDLVCAAIIAVCAHGPESGPPTIYQIASGVRNPFRYGTLVDLCEQWFTERPLYDTQGQPIVVPTWSFPGRGKVQGELRRAAQTLRFVERIVASLPVRGELAEKMSTLEEKRELAERALGYVELYGAYTETEARFRVDRTIELFETLDELDQKAFCFDPAVIDWAHYVTDVHLPSVVDHARVRTSPGKRITASREDRARAAILSEEPRVAVFDLEQTLINSNVVESYAWLATRHLSPLHRAQLAIELIAEGPRLLAVDRRDRGDFLRSFYRRYEGAPVARVRADSWELFSDLILTRSFPDGLARVREHRRLGHKTLLITGALDFVVAPLEPLFDEIVCASLGESNGRFTGEMVATPPTGEARAILMEEWAASFGLGRDAIVAYADSSSDLPMLEAAGHPVAVNPETKLAAIARKRGWLVEQWSPASGGPVDVSLSPPERLGRAQPLQNRQCVDDRDDWCETMKELLVERSLPRFAAARAAAMIAGSGNGIGVGPLRLVDREAPKLPGPDWYRIRPRLSGICGSDLSTIDGVSSRYFEEIVSFPFVLGHEIVGLIDGGERDGERVVLEPVLGCLVRGIDPPCDGCAAGRKGACERIAYGHLKPGLQTGFCADTGGGWAEGLVAHESQLHLVPDELSDEAAVIVEPTACAIHAALLGGVAPGERVVVLGSGTLGLATIAALRAHADPGELIAVAKHPIQRELARTLGADRVVQPDALERTVRRATGSLALPRDGAVGRLTGGADVVFDCVGSSSSISSSLDVVRPGGRIVLVGMPGTVRVDLAPLWQREVTIVGAYAYGTEMTLEGPRSTFDLAFELVASAGLERLVSARYPLERYEEAVRHAASAGRRGAVKVVFDLRSERGNWRSTLVESIDETVVVTPETTEVAAKVPATTARAKRASTARSARSSTTRTKMDETSGPTGHIASSPGTEQAEGNT